MQHEKPHTVTLETFPSIPRVEFQTSPNIPGLSPLRMSGTPTLPSPASRSAISLPRCLAQAAVFANIHWSESLSLRPSTDQWHQEQGCHHLRLWIRTPWAQASWIGSAVVLLLKNLPTLNFTLFLVRNTFLGAVSWDPPLPLWTPKALSILSIPSFWCSLPSHCIVLG